MLSVILLSGVHYITSVSVPEGLVHNDSVCSQIQSSSWTSIYSLWKLEALPTHLSVANSVAGEEIFVFVCFCGSMSRQNRQNTPISSLLLGGGLMRRIGATSCLQRIVC